MPQHIAIESLTSKSSRGEISAAISESIRQLMDGGMSQEEATRLVREQAAKVTGRQPGERV